MSWWKRRPPVHMAILVLVVLVLYVLPTQVRPANFLQDDSYFYLQVASNIVEGHGSTFHRVTLTNGYHPLWLWLSVLSLTLAGGDKQVGLHITFAIQIMLSLGAAYFFYKIAKRLEIRYWSLGLAAVLAYLLGTGVYGSEAHVNAFTLTAGIYFFLTALIEDGYRNWVAAGLLLGLSVLARLDNVFVVTSLVGFGVLARGNTSLVCVAKRLGVMGLAVMVVLVPYLVYNQVTFGHVVPISGSIKSTFPRVAIDLSNLGEVGLLTTFFGVLALVVAVFFITEPLRRWLLLGLGTGVIVHAAYVVIFTDHYTFWPWYYVPGIITAGIVIGQLTGMVASVFERFIDWQAIRGLAIMLSVLVVVAGAARAWLKAEVLGTPPELLRVNEYRWPDELAIWMGNHLPADSLVFAYDWPGAIAYYSNQRILPMDGLMSDFQYNEDLLVMGIADYLCSRQAAYYFGPLENGSGEYQELEVTAPLYRSPVGKLSLAPDALVVQVREVVSQPEKTPPFAIWYIGDGCSGNE